MKIPILYLQQLTLADLVLIAGDPAAGLPDEGVDVDDIAHAAEWLAVHLEEEAALAEADDRRWLAEMFEQWKTSAKEFADE